MLGFSYSLGTVALASFPQEEGGGDGGTIPNSACLGSELGIGLGL